MSFYNSVTGLFLQTEFCVSLSVCPLVTSAYCGKTTESIEMPFGMMGRVGPRNHVLDGGLHRRHTANTVERLRVGAMRGSWIDSSEITLASLVVITIGPFLSGRCLVCKHGSHVTGIYQKLTGLA